MIDLSCFKDYFLETSAFGLEYARNKIKDIGFDKWFEIQLKNFLDCSKTSADGRRMIQTNLRQYKCEITITINMIEDCAENKDYYYEKLVTQHNNNIEFEAINGLAYDVNNFDKKKPTKTRTKKEPTLFNEKPKKETAAERKLKAHIAKINSFSIKIKPVRNDNAV